MREWLIECSIDGANVDYSEIVVSSTEPDFWTCYEIATAHGCVWFTIYENEEEVA